jgi:WD40 repeat protein
VSADGLHVVAASQAEPVVYAFACRSKPAAPAELDCRKTSIADDYATAVAIARDGSLAALGLEAGGLVIVDLARGETVAKIEVSGKVQSLAWHRRKTTAMPGTGGDGSADWLAVGVATGELFVADARGERIAELPAQSTVVTALAWDDATGRLASSCEVVSICIWQPPPDGDGGYVLAATLAGHLNTVLDIVWSPDGDRLASTATDQSVKVWTIEPDHLSYGVPVPDGVPLTDMAASADGKWLAAGSQNGEIQIFSRKDLAWAGKIAATRDSEIRSVTWHPDGRSIAVSDSEGFVAVRTWPGEALVREAEISNSAVDTVRWLPDGVTIAAALRDGTIVLWSSRDGSKTELKERHPASATGLAVDARRNRIVSSGDQGEVLVWDVATRDKIATMPSTETVKVPPIARATVVLGPDGRFAVVAGNDGNLIVYDLDEKRIHHVFRGNSPQIEHAALTLDGGQVASVSSDGFLDVRAMADFSTFASVKVYPQDRLLGQQTGSGATYHLRSVLWLPEVSSLAISASNGELRLISYDTAAWRRRARSVFRLE